MSCNLRLGFAGNFGRSPEQLSGGWDLRLGSATSVGESERHLSASPPRMQKQALLTPVTCLRLSFALLSHWSTLSTAPKDALPLGVQSSYRRGNGSSYYTNTIISLLPCNYSRMPNTPWLLRSQSLFRKPLFRPQHFSTFLECTGNASPGVTHCQTIREGPLVKSTWRALPTRSLVFSLSVHALQNWHRCQPPA